MCYKRASLLNNEAVLQNATENANSCCGETTSHFLSQKIAGPSDVKCFAMSKVAVDRHDLMMRPFIVCATEQLDLQCNVQDGLLSGQLSLLSLHGR